MPTSPCSMPIRWTTSPTAARSTWSTSAVSNSIAPACAQSGKPAGKSRRVLVTLTELSSSGIGMPFTGQLQPLSLKRRSNAASMDLCHEAIDCCGRAHDNQNYECAHRDLESSCMKQSKDLPAVKPRQSREDAESYKAQAGERD